MRAALTLTLVLAAGAAHADRGDRVAAADDDNGSNQVVVVNAAAKLGDIGQIQRVQKVLSSRGLLFKLPEPLEATLDGRNVLVADLEAIKEAYSNANYSDALKMIDEDKERILKEAANRDPMPALAELAQWRGIVQAALGNEDEAVRQFQAAYRFNPAWTIDKKLMSPRVRAMVKKARVESDGKGTLRVDVDPSEAKVAIDGGETKPANKKISLSPGIHLVMVTAEGRKPYADLVTIEADSGEKLQIALDPEDKLDRASKLVDETVAAPAGKPRLKHARKLARLTGVSRMLVVEDGGEDHISFRLYDVDTKKVSKLLRFDSDATSAVIARKVKAALDPENLVDADTILIATPGGREETHWYQRWYVWAGVAAVVGGSVLGYEYMTREPTSIRGFQ